MAARHFSTRDFMRHMPDRVLERYFAKCGVLANIDFSELGEHRVEALFEAWVALPSVTRSPLDAELLCIFELCDETGTRAILDEAAHHLAGDALEAFTVKLGGLSNHHERAMVTYLDHFEYWKGATRFHHADLLNTWSKRKNMQHGAARVDEGNRKILESLIKGYYHLKDGRGDHCEVEAYRRGEKDYFFAFPEDYSQRSADWGTGTLGMHDHHPAFEIVFVYDRKAGSLDVKCPGGRKVVEAMQGMFAHAILGLKELPTDPDDERVFDLAPLTQSDFDFKWKPGSGIESVVVTKIRLASRRKFGDKITLEANTKKDPDAVFKMLAQARSAFAMGYFDVEMVVLSALVAQSAMAKAKKISFRLTHPNGCSLKYEGLELRLREMLEESGLEPKAPENVTDSPPSAVV